MSESVARRYALWLEWGTRLGLALLVIGFVAYVGGLLEPHVAIGHLPELWGLPSDEFLRRTGQRAGWGWLAMLSRGDVAMLVPISLLASCSLACVLAAVPAFRARGERAMAVICILQALVLVAAAFAPGH